MRKSHLKNRIESELARLNAAKADLELRIAKIDAQIELLNRLESKERREPLNAIRLVCNG